MGRSVKNVLQEFKIEVTHTCELNCIHCSSNAGPANVETLSKSEVLEILLAAAELGVQRVAFSGGEPLLWPDLAEVVARASQAGMEPTVYTTGNVSSFSAIAEELSRAGVLRMVFSVFGANETIHERVTRKAGSFKNTVDGVQRASEQGMSTELHFVPLAYNYRDILKIAKLGSDIGVCRMSVLRFVPQGRGQMLRSQVLSKMENLDLRKLILALRDEYGENYVRTGSPYNFLLLNRDPVCRAGVDRLTIGPDKSVYPCDGFKGINIVELGIKPASITRESLQMCWEKSDLLTSVRDYLGSQFGAACLSCKLLSRCNSGCLAQKVIANKSLAKAPDPDCIAR